MPVDITRTPDAVLFPPTIFKGEFGQRLVRHKQVFGPVLKSERVAVSAIAGLPVAIVVPFARTQVLKAEPDPPYEWCVATFDKAKGWTINPEPVAANEACDQVKFGYFVKEDLPANVFATDEPASVPDPGEGPPQA